MTDDELRRACEAWLDRLTCISIRSVNGTVYPDAVDEVVRFAKQQQAAGVRMAGKALKDALNPYSSRFQKPEHAVNWCEAKAKEMEA